MKHTRNPRIICTNFQNYGHRFNA